MNLNVKYETVKLSEEKVGENLCDLELGKEILDMTSKAWLQKNDEGFPRGAVVENLPVSAGDTGSCPGLGRSHMPRSN